MKTKFFNLIMPNRLLSFDENSILINRKGRSSDAVSGERPSVQAAGQMACPPITPAMALATAMITFRSVLQIDDLLLLILFHLRLDNSGTVSLVFFGFHPFAVVFTAANLPGPHRQCCRPAYRCHRRPHRHFRSSAGTPLPAAGLGSLRWRPDACTPA